MANWSDARDAILLTRDIATMDPNGINFTEEF